MLGQIPAGFVTAVGRPVTLERLYRLDVFTLECILPTGATKLLVDILGKNPNTTVVVIDEVDTDNWGVGGETVTALRLKAGSPSPQV